VNEPGPPVFEEQNALSSKYKVISRIFTDVNTLCGKYAGILKVEASDTHLK
jgi:choline kinase